MYHYKKRYWAFPHETTLDQMFSEEQFEAYRALGYHATNGFFGRRDDFAKIAFDDYPGADEDVQEDIDCLDRLFGQHKPGAAGEKQSFKDWLPRPAAKSPPTAPPAAAASPTTTASPATAVSTSATTSPAAAPPSTAAVPPPATAS